MSFKEIFSHFSSGGHLLGRANRLCKLSIGHHGEHLCGSSLTLGHWFNSR